MADIGQNEDFEKAKQKAKAIGAKDVSAVSNNIIIMPTFIKTGP